MTKLEKFIIAVILIGTLCSILYLSYIAEQMGKYSFSQNDGKKYFILFSSTGGKTGDEKDLSKLLVYTQDALTAAGYDAVVITDTKDIEDKLKESMKKNKKYVFLDINSTKLLTTQNSVIFRVGNNKNSKYDENYEYAQMIKNNIKDLKVSIISDPKNNYYQDIAYRAVRIEISEKIALDKVESCISRILKPIIQ